LRQASTGINTLAEQALSAARSLKAAAQQAHSGQTAASMPEGEIASGDRYRRPVFAAESSVAAEIPAFPFAGRT
jgi:hypothetical protein